MEKREKVSIKNHIDGKTMCKYWTTSSRQAKPHDMIFAMKTLNPQPGDNIYEKDLEKMAEIV